jgi:hypothetical protein
MLVTTASVPTALGVALCAVAARRGGIRTRLLNGASANALGR